MKKSVLMQIERMTLLGAIMLLVGGVLNGQNLSLPEAIRYSQESSLAARRAQTTQLTAYWSWRRFKSDYRPQLLLSGVLPSFTRSYVEAFQPDGTINFQQVSFNNSSLDLLLSQRLPGTGGSIFVQKQLQRFDNFNGGSTLYNGIPLAIGWSQPLFQFNPFRWEQQIEPLRYAESRQAFIGEMEGVALQTTVYYFDLLLAQVNFQIAQTNVENTDTLFQIAQHKLTLGKISRNDLLQLQLAVLDARKDLASSRQQVQTAMLQLRTYLGYEEDGGLDLALPGLEAPFAVDAERALAEARANRAAAIGFERRLLEAKREVEKVQKENGLNANLDVAFGLSNRGDRPTDIYRSPQDREYLELNLTIPILDWGRAKARTATAQANMQLVQQSVEQERQTLEQEVITQVNLLVMLQEQVSIFQEADQIAAERYQIAQDRFMLSDLSITDLNLALQEKDRAKRDFIVAMRDYWVAFYNLRLLTGFDFIRQQKIHYVETGQ